MAKTCSNCKHSCYIKRPGKDDMELVCVHTCLNCKYSRHIKHPDAEDIELECTTKYSNCHFGVTRVGEDDVKDCWESIKGDSYDG